MHVLLACRFDTRSRASGQQSRNRATSIAIRHNQAMPLLRGKLNTDRPAFERAVIQKDLDEIRELLEQERPERQGQMGLLWEKEWLV